MSKEYIQMKKFIEKNSLLKKGDTCLAAVSGGADSMCMLDLLREYCTEFDIRLGVVTVNHGFRPEAVEEAAYVEEFCRNRDISFYLKEIGPGKCEKSEEAARNYRYSLINEVAQKEGFNRIALAHNAGDRAETMLFNLFRGSGINGLAGIRAKREQYIRPILFMERKDIEKYLCARGIKYVTDSSNLTDDYSRNKIRHKIVPTAVDINTESIRHMNEAADSLARIAAYIDSQAQKAYEKLVEKNTHGVCINARQLGDLDEVIQGEIVRKMLMGMTPKLKDITGEHIKSILNLTEENKNRKICLPYNIQVYREYDLIRITNDFSENAGFESFAVEIADLFEVKEKLIEIQGMVFKLRIIDIEESREFKNPLDYIPRNKYTKWFDCDKIEKPIEFRTRRDGDYLTVDGDGHHKSLSRCLIDFKIPKALRNQVIVVANGDEILWLAGYRDSFVYRVSEKTHRILEISLVEEKNG